MKALIERLRERAQNARSEGTATALGDALHFEEAADRIDALEVALQRIDDWSHAYPIDVFPEPDLKRARELLEAGGISLGAVSASNMRHAIEGVGAIAREALGRQE